MGKTGAVKTGSSKTGGETATISQSASLVTQDADQTAVSGTRQAETALTTQDADQTAIAGTRVADATVTTQDADQSTVAGQTDASATASLLTQDADQSTVTGDRGIGAVTTSQDADKSTISGRIGIIAALKAQDSDNSNISGIRKSSVSLINQDADQGTFSGARKKIGLIITQDSDQSSVAGDTVVTGASTVTQEISRTLEWTETYDRTLPLMSDNIEPPDNYISGESATLKVTITNDGSPHGLSGATPQWWLLPERGASKSDAVLSTNDTGINVNIVDEANGRVNVTIDQGITEALGGTVYWQLFELDDSGPGLQKWNGYWFIEDA